MLQVSDIPEQLLHFCIQNSACQYDVLAQLRELQHMQNNLQATRSQLIASQAALATSLATHQALQLQLTSATSSFSKKATELAAREEKVGVCTVES
jgi:septal ring factor EnvC (AmiA/AmiB activator)